MTRVMTFERVRRSLTFQIQNIDTQIAAETDERERHIEAVSIINHKLFDLREEQEEILAALSALSEPLEDERGL